MTTPKPTTRTAYLTNATGRPTLHTYVETRPAESPGPVPQAWEHIFRCSITGVERRWGLDFVLFTEVN